MEWFLVPKLGEKISWGMYMQPSGKCEKTWNMHVTGKARVHGIEGVELTATVTLCGNITDTATLTFVAQLTDSYFRCLAEAQKEGYIRNYSTFLDGNEFMPRWFFGEDNCGNDINLSPKGVFIDLAILSTVLIRIFCWTSW